MPFEQRATFSNEIDTQLPSLLNKLRDGSALNEIKCQGNLVDINGELGQGGSKTVYDAIIDLEPIALALPNSTDDLNTVKKKWSEVLKEPENTKLVEGLGICTNSCDIFPVEIGGIQFPALRSKRYQDLPYKVIDRKNPNSSTVNGAVIPNQGLNEENVAKMLESTLDDVVTLVDNGLAINADALNLCVDQNGKIRLFLCDLGSGLMEYKINKKPSEIDRVSQWYVSWIMDVWASTFSFNEWTDKYKTFSEKFDDHKKSDGVHASLTKQLSEKLSVK